ncbi:MAG TPA: hypothetical protein VJ904_13435, partial [Tichowtungia sp.]|nr:hypothetical protein [Tichowtungia sp.]
ESGAGNLAVYALGSSGQASIRRSTIVANGLNVSWNRRLYADDLNYTLMKSTNLTAGSLWVPVSNAVVQVVPGDDPAMEKVEVDVAMDGPTQYIRLGVEKE